MKNKVAFIHTTMNTPVPLRDAFKKRFPDTELITILDDSIVPELKNNENTYTPGIVHRLMDYGVNVEACGAAAAVCICTTIAGAVAQAACGMDIPFLMIDGPMLDKAVRMGENVALLVTADTTIKSSSDAAARAAACAGRVEVRIDTILVSGAFEALNKEGDKIKHDTLIAECAKEAAKTHDVIVLAQVSMAEAAKQLHKLSVPVLTSLETGIEQIAGYLDKEVL